MVRASGRPCIFGVAAWKIACDDPPADNGRAARRLDEALSLHFRELACSYCKTIILSETRKGRPTAISPENYRGVCLEISALEFRGNAIGRAKSLVAKKHCVDWRTPHRIWSNRAEYPDDGVTLKEAENFLATLGD